jgi:hypothetical protein
MIRIKAPRVAGSADEGPLRHGLAALEAALADVASALRSIDDPGGGPAPLDEAAEVWADDEYLYIEGRLPDDLGTNIDLSTCGRVLMIRVAAGDERESRAARPPAVPGGPGVA